MNYRTCSAALAAVVILVGGAAPSLAAPDEDAISFTARDGSTVEAFQGAFTVPENRAADDSRSLTVRYVRFPATTDTPAAPIVYLAGGPGGSGIGTARGPRFPLFMALREVADVIALDQRGTGQSDGPPSCRSSASVPFDQHITRDEAASAYRAAWAECRTFWEGEGVDIAGYTTVQSAADLEDLRRHLGVDSLSLWGISYGTHLAFEALKQMDGRIARVVLASAEGPGQTVKLPARTDAYLERMQAAINTAAGDNGPVEFIDLMRRVIERLEAEPVTVSVQRSETETTDLTIGAFEVQLLTGFTMSDPGNVGTLLQLYRAADAGDFTPMANVIGRYIRDDDTVELSGMSTAMDIASGISAGRAELVAAQAETSLLGDALNFPMPHLAGVEPDLDLGDAFRTNTVTDVPTLLLSGTLDGRTYPEAQAEATAGFANLTHVTVANAGHNLFMTAPEVTEVIVAFMRGEPVADQVIETPAPSLGE